MIELETARLRVRRFTVDDAPFVRGLVNEPSWHQFIGDKGVRTDDDARTYLRNGALAMYERHGFGLMMVELKAGNVPIGMCGLIRRDAIEDVDIGFAMLPAYRGQGYAFEAASAVLAYGKDVLGMKRIVAITSLDNESSIKLLERIGLRFERTIEFGADKEVLRLFGTGP